MAVEKESKGDEENKIDGDTPEQKDAYRAMRDIAILADELIVEAGIRAGIGMQTTTVFAHSLYKEMGAHMFKTVMEVTRAADLEMVMRDAEMNIADDGQEKNQNETKPEHPLAKMHKRLMEKYAASDLTVKEAEPSHTETFEVAFPTNQRNSSSDGLYQQLEEAKDKLLEIGWLERKDNMKQRDGFSESQLLDFEKVFFAGAYQMYCVSSQIEKLNPEKGGKILSGVEKELLKWIRLFDLSGPKN